MQTRLVNAWETFNSNRPWGLFLKSPETFLVPQLFLYLRIAKVLSFVILLVFLTLKSCLKGQLFKTSGLQIDNWLFGPEKFSGLSRNRPLLRILPQRGFQVTV